MINKTKQTSVCFVTAVMTGAGESGKSTFAKQMKILRMSGYTDAERMAFRKVIFTNILDCALSLVLGAQDLNITIGAREVPLSHPIYI